MSESVPTLSSIAFGSLDRYKHVTRRIPVTAKVDADGVLHLNANNPDDDWLVAKAFEDAEAEDSEAMT